jgi:hypothetical protein
MPEAHAELGVLARMHDVIGIRTGDKHDRELPSVGLLTLEDAETGEQIEIDTSSRATRLGFLKAADAQASERLRDFRRKRVDTISLKTDQDYIPALRAFFRTRERRLQIR